MDYEMPKETLVFDGSKDSNEAIKDFIAETINSTTIPSDSPLFALPRDYINTRVAREKDDAVNHPAHYTYGKIEVIDVIKDQLSKDQFVGYCLGNALKYVCRCQHKGKMKEDIKKAIWYLNKITE